MTMSRRGAAGAPEAGYRTAVALPRPRSRTLAGESS